MLLLAKLISTDTNGLPIGETGGEGKICVAGEACGGTLLGKAYGGDGTTPYALGVKGYFGLYGKDIDTTS